MHQIEPIIDTNGGRSQDRPYIVKVDGKVLMGKRSPRRFKDSFAAGLAGAREIDRQRRAPPQPEKPHG